MILRTHEEQIKFLTKNYENIERLSESIITSGDEVVVSNIRSNNRT